MPDHTALTTLWSFKGSNNAPNSVVFRGGALYGTTGSVGSVGYGSVFELTPPATVGNGWTETALYNFTGGSDGGYPNSNLVFDRTGSLYGTTQYGGSGDGVVYQLKPPPASGGAWTETVLYNFQSGGNPYPLDLVIDNDGALYGTSYSGAPYYSGIVFKLSPPTSPSGVWNSTTLYTFAGGNDGKSPAGGVAFGPNGVFYGTTLGGGAFGWGTVYQLAPPSSPGGAWTETVLHSFAGGLDGAQPSGVLVVGPDGSLYGTASGGNKNCGVVFQLSESGGVWTKSLVHSFTGYRAAGRSDGSLPANLTISADGSLFGVTRLGGACTGCGTVFELRPPPIQGGTWSETIIHSFRPQTDGSSPNNVVFDSTGNLYGSTNDGASNGFAFLLTAPSKRGKHSDWTETIVYDFGATSDAGTPSSPLIADRQGALYGTTSSGGRISCIQPGPIATCGTVFQLSPPSSPGGAWSENVLHNFAGGMDGSLPHSGVVFGPDGALYGTTAKGGARNLGTVFRLAPPTSPGGAWTNTALYSFQGGPDGSGAGYSAVVFDPAGALYGTTAAGGPHNQGTVFQLIPSSSAGGAWSESVLYGFTGGADGSAPIGVVYSKGLLYGTTRYGGSAGGGIVFALTPPASPGGAWTEQIVHTFGADGRQPNFGLLLDSSGALYGATRGGGSEGCGHRNGCGIIYQLVPPPAPGTAWSEAILHTFAGGADGDAPDYLQFHGSALLGTTYQNSHHFGKGTVFELKPPSSTGGTWIKRNLAVLRNTAGRNPLGGTLWRGSFYGVTAQGGTFGYGTVFALPL